MFNLNNVRMSQESQKLDLTENPCSIRYVLEDVMYLLDGYFLSSVYIYCGAYDPVASFTNDFLHLVSTCIPILCEKVCLRRTLQEIL
jgi:hypothetical protein